MKTTKNPPKNPQSISKKSLTKLAISLQIVLVNFYCLSAKAQAQTIVPALDGTGTTVTPAVETGTTGPTTRFDIEGGKLSSDRTNLFHSLEQFGLSQNQIANFISNPDIRNILARIGGGSPSLINGLIQVTGGNSNLFLMNPSGIIFGNNASLNVPAAFTATTATSIGFGSNSFNATGTNDYTTLTGAPNSFTFSADRLGAIINTADLAVKSGQNLTLLGGTVVSSGTLSAPGGQITVASVPGQNVVRLSQEGNLLSLEIEPPSGTAPPPPSGTLLSIASLPELLTGIGATNATGVSVNASGQVVLTASNQVVAAGDVAVQGVNAGAIAIQAANNLTTGNLTSSQAGPIGLEAKGDIRTGNLDSHSTNSDGGKITVTSRTGTVQTGNINAWSIDKNSNAADIAISAELSIQTGNIDAHSEDKQGGSVTFSARNDAQVTYINTEGKTAGGNIDITVGRYFLATGTFNSEPNCSTGCSLSASTTNSANAGDITIRHGGTALKTPFTVGPDYNQLNGTAGIIATGGPSGANVIAYGSYDSPGPQVIQPTTINITASATQNLAKLI
ncbi:MAG: filamentous hemagglutinin N-terminal domain-containing protein [Microcoleus sp. CSU_2_2]|nr:filamentous hemagglutinin N-terminal domain-containing protein [Microcoleus sp. SU_5_3]NJS13107.1 filamentous hemagglutinin N-terminal domain-containing protein [Microcoleus sp. CSU_2_2]